MASTRLPRKAVFQSAGNGGLGLPLSRRNDTSGNAGPFRPDIAFADNMPALLAQSRIGRGRRRRPPTMSTALSTAAIHWSNMSLNSEIIAITDLSVCVAPREAPHHPARTALGKDHLCLCRLYLLSRLYRRAR